MFRPVLSATISLLLFAFPVFAAQSTESSHELKDRIREVLQENPELIFQALQGQEEKLFDLIQVGQEKKNKSRIRSRRLQQLKNPKKAALHPERPVWGNPESPVSIIAFSDFQSATCSNADRIINELLAAHPEVNYRYRHNPLGIHKMSRPAALYYEALALQDHAKAMLLKRLILENRLKIKKNGIAELDILARQCGADMNRLRRDIASDKIGSIVDEDIHEAKKLGFTASPVFLVNGVTVTGAVPRDEFEEVINMVLNPEKSIR